MHFDTPLLTIHSEMTLARFEEVMTLKMAMTDEDDSIRRTFMSFDTQCESTEYNTLKWHVYLFLFQLGANGCITLSEYQLQRYRACITEKHHARCQHTKTFVVDYFILHR